jgi:hypothetical protein
MKKVEKKIQTKEFQEDVAGCLGRTQGHIRWSCLSWVDRRKSEGRNVVGCCTTKLFDHFILATKEPPKIKFVSSQNNSILSQAKHE